MAGLGDTSIRVPLLCPGVMGTGGPWLSRGTVIYQSWHVDLLCSLRVGIKRFSRLIVGRTELVGVNREEEPVLSAAEPMKRPTKIPEEPTGTNSSPGSPHDHRIGTTP